MAVLPDLDMLPWMYERTRVGKMNKLDIWTKKNHQSRILGISAPLKEWLRVEETSSSLPALRLSELVCSIAILQETLCPLGHHITIDAIKAGIKLKGIGTDFWYALRKATEQAESHPNLGLSDVEEVITEMVKTDWIVRVLRTHYKIIDPPRLYYFVITTPKNRDRISAVVDTWLEPDVKIAPGGASKIIQKVVPPNYLLQGLDPKKDKVPYRRLIDRILHIFEVIKRTADRNQTYDWIIKVDDDTYVRKAVVLYDLVKMGDSPLGRIRGRKYCGYVTCFLSFFFDSLSSNYI